MEKKTVSSTTLGKTLSISLVLLLLFTVCVPIASAHNAPFPAGYDSSHLVIDTISEPETLDPAWAYDAASGEIIFNVYETMVCYDVVWTDGPYSAGKVDQFKPLLATAWAWTAGPAPYVKTITFTIRSDVTFHDGNFLTPADVEYSWERWMVQDRDGGAQWMFYYPLMGAYAAADPQTDPYFGDRINNAITSTATTVSIHLMTDFPETTFMQIMCQPWTGVVEKAWAVGLGDFDGNWGNGWEYIYNTWHNPGVSFIEGAMMGTGPYRFDYWVQGAAYSITRYDNYWDGWPARVYRQPSSNNERIGGFISRATWNLLTSWTTRRARFLAGDADFTAVPRQYRDQVLGQIVGGETIRSYYPCARAPYMLALDAFFFTFDVNPQSPYLGPGFNPAAPLTIAEDRIPINLFNDIHMRRAFRYAFNWPLFLSSAYLGEATQPADPIIPGLAYDNPANALPAFDLTKAQQELQSAHGGAIWANGMSFTLLYNSGNVARETAVTILKNNIESLNPKFHLRTQEVAWSSTYLPRMVAGMLPLFTNGWTADYTDPDDFAFPFMHTYGTLSQWQRYSNPRVDELIEAGTLMPMDTAAYSGQLDQPDSAALNAVFTNPGSTPPDSRWPRRSIYYELQALYTDDVPGFALAQVKGRHWEQAWIRGWYYNPLYGGSLTPGIDSTAPTTPTLDIYHLWKAKTHFGDANNDGAVNVLDLGYISAHYTDFGWPYNPAADINGGIGTGTTGLKGPIRGIPDGRVDMLDLRIVDLYWDGPPSGPLHPSGGSGGPLPAITTSVNPLTTTSFVGEPFSVDLTVSEVQNLWGYRYVLRYNTNVLTAIDCTNLADLVDPDFTTVEYMEINDPEGYVDISCRTSGMGFSTTETKPLLSITFLVDGAGTSALDIDEDESYLANLGALAWKYPCNLNVNDGTAIAPLPVYVDIKPASWPNPLKLKDQGSLPVAICGTADFDVRTIDVATIKLAQQGVSVWVTPIGWEYKDVAAPWTGELGGGWAIKRDGYIDLLLKFSTQEVITTLGLNVFVDQKIPLIVTGNLNDAAGGSPFVGQDYVWIGKT